MIHMNLSTQKVGLALLIASAIFLMACPKNPPKESLSTTTTAQDTTTVATQQSGPDAAELERQRLEAERLEGERKRVEEMINKLMSEDIYFEYDKAVLTERARELLSQVGEILQREARFHVLVEGHTDERGTEAYNLSLGGKRAQAVVQYLTDYGVAQTRMETVSFGEEKPKVEGSTETDYEKNRRATFRVQVK